MYIYIWYTYWSVFLNNIAPISAHNLHFSTKSHRVNNGYTEFARYVT